MPCHEVDALALEHIYFLFSNNSIWRADVNETW